jgi:D-alanyl-D-alanine carboxypeptidase
VEAGLLGPVKVLRGVENNVKSEMKELSPLLIKKGQEKSVTQTLTMAEDLEAPVLDQQIIGELTLMIEGIEAAKYNIYAANGVPRLGIFNAFKRICKALVS